MIIRALSAAEWLVGRFNWLAIGLLKGAAIGLLATMTAIVVGGVFFRYVLDDALSWSEEIAKFVMIWMTFLAAPIGLKLGAHVGIEALLAALKGRARQVLFCVIYIAIIVLMVVFVDEGIFLTLNARIQRASTVDISIFYVYMAMPIGCAVMATVAFELLLGALKGVIDPSQAKALPHHEIPMTE